MENEKVIDGGLLRFNAILAAESFGTPDDLEFQDDADLIHTDSIEVPSEGVPAPSEPPITARVTTPAPPVPVATSKRVLTIVWRDGEPVEWSDGQKIGRGKKPRKVSK